MTTTPPTAGFVRVPRLPAPNGPWLNGEPLTDWRGAVRLVDFWTYSCINCQRTLPALRAWHDRYATHGLSVIGVHTPEFSFEHDPDNVARALHELDVRYPVVLDNDQAIWQSFANRYWPHRYLSDAAGRIRHEHSGEGGEYATEQAIRALLQEAGAGALPEPVYAIAPLAQSGAGAVCIPGTPELFTGYYRGVSGNPGGFVEERTADYSDPGGYREGYIHLQGRWHVDADRAAFAGPDPGYLRVAFRGSAVQLVMAPVGAPVAVTARIAPLPDEDRAGSTTGAGAVLVVDSPRLYSLPSAAWLDQDRAGGHFLLTLSPTAPGLAIYSCTFAPVGCVDADHVGAERS